MRKNPKDKLGKTKPPLSLVPPVAVVQEAMAMKNGGKKYGPYNWRDTAVMASVYVTAALGHLFKWMDREDDDDESGVSHLAHVRANCGILIDAMTTGKLIDDRPTKGAVAKEIKRLTKEIK